MDAATITLITTLIGLVVKFLPELKQIGEEIVTLYSSGKTLSEEDLAKMQAFTDKLVEQGRTLEASILQAAVKGV